MYATPPAKNPTKNGRKDVKRLNVGGLSLPGALISERNRAPTARWEAAEPETSRRMVQRQDVRKERNSTQLQRDKSQTQPRAWHSSKRRFSTDAPGTATVLATRQHYTDSPGTSSVATVMAPVQVLPSRLQVSSSKVWRPSALAFDEIALKEVAVEEDDLNGGQPEQHQVAVVEICETQLLAATEAAEAEAAKLAYENALHVLQESISAVLRRRKAGATIQRRAKVKQVANHLTDLLRHVAQKEDVNISPDGWVSTADAVSYVNHFGNGCSTADVWAVARSSAQGDLELSHNGDLIRATSGHTMRGISAVPGLLLTLQSASPVASFGCSAEHLWPILRFGISCGDQRYIHLENSWPVPQSKLVQHSVLVWVDVHRAIRDADVCFYETRKGAILTDGLGGNGKLPPTLFSVVIELCDGLLLDAMQARLLERLFSGCSRVRVRKMHVTSLGTLVLRTDAYDADANLEMPTITKMSKATSIVKEIRELTFVASLTAGNTVMVTRGPVCIDACGVEKDQTRVTAGDVAGVAFFMAHGCWQLPRYQTRNDNVILFDTVLDVISGRGAMLAASQISVLGSFHSASEFTDAAIIDDLLGAGGPLASIMLKTACRPQLPSPLVREWYESVFDSMVASFMPPVAKAHRYRPPHVLQPCFDRLQGANGPNSQKLESALCHFVLECSPDIWGGDACGELALLIQELDHLAAAEPCGWMRGLKPLQAQQLGGLSLRNIVVDLVGSTWLMDFSSSGLMGVLTDAASLISSVLMESFPLAFSGDDLKAAQVRLLASTLGLTDDDAKELKALAASSTSTAALDMALASSSKLRPVMTRISSEEVAEARMQEVFAVVEALLAMETGQAPELWQMAKRVPPAEFSLRSQQIFELCTTIIQRAMVLVAKSSSHASASQGEEGHVACLPADLHSSHLYIPLLLHSLSALRSADLPLRAKRVSFLMTQKLAGLLRKVLHRPPATPPASEITTSATYSLAAGQVVMLLDEDRQAISSSVHPLQLAVIKESNVQEAMGMATNAIRPVSFDATSQVVLPWKQPTSGTVEAIIADASGVAMNLMRLGSLELPNEEENNVMQLMTAVDCTIQALQELQASFLPGRIFVSLAFNQPTPTALTTSLGATVKLPDTTDNSPEGVSIRVQICVSKDGLVSMTVNVAKLQSLCAPSPSMTPPQLDRAHVHLSLRVSSLAEGGVEEPPGSINFVRQFSEALGEYRDRLENVKRSVVLQRREALAHAVSSISAIVKDAQLSCMVSRLEELRRLVPLEGASITEVLDAAKYRIAPRVRHLVPGIISERVSKQLGAIETLDGPLSAEKAASIRNFLECATMACEALGKGDLGWWVRERLDSAGYRGLRKYSSGQRLTILVAGTWHDATVLPMETVASPAMHCLQVEHLDGEVELSLNPWNHAPLHIPQSEFEVLRLRHCRTLLRWHATVFDALSARRLSIDELCIPIGLADHQSAKADAWHACEGFTSLLDVKNARALARWFCSMHTRRTKGDASEPACVLITAPPAAGKSCLASQLIAHIVSDQNNRDLIPVLVTIQLLLRFMLLADHRATFDRSWNWVDAYLQCVHGVESEMYQMLREALIARRVLLLMDGIDEGGQLRESIERHMVELQMQGHLILVTSRPVGLHVELFREGFHYMKLRPLTKLQQQQVIEQRLGSPELSEELLRYIALRLPLDEDGEECITGNPLLLSMVISVFESSGEGNEDRAMPETVSELYATMSRAMIERAERKQRGVSVSVPSDVAAVLQLHELLQAAFFDAHSHEHRVVEKKHLEAAALTVAKQQRLEEVEGLDAQQQQHGVLRSDLGSLPSDVEHAMSTLCKQLPLMQMITAEPLQIQSAHLSFQEYFAVKAICTKGFCLPANGSAPWRWSSWWSNALRLGMELGTEFEQGLNASSINSKGALNLRSLVGGHRPTAFLAIGVLVTTVTELDLRDNRMDNHEAKLIASGLSRCVTLTSIRLAGNRLTAEGVKSITEALTATDSRPNPVRELDVSRNPFESERMTMAAVVEAFLQNTTLEILKLGSNLSSDTGADAFAVAFATGCEAFTQAQSYKTADLEAVSPQSSSSLRELCLSHTGLAASFAAGLHAIFVACPTLEVLNLSGNNLDVDDGIVMATALTGAMSLRTLNLSSNNLCNARLSWSAAAIGGLVDAFFSNPPVRSETESSLGALPLTQLLLHNNGLCGLWRDFIHGSWKLRGSYTVVAIDLLVTALLRPSRVHLHPEGLYMGIHDFVCAVDEERLKQALATHAARPTPQDSTVVSQHEGPPSLSAVMPPLPISPRGGAGGSLGVAAGNDADESLAPDLLADKAGGAHVAEAPTSTAPIASVPQDPKPASESSDQAMVADSPTSFEDILQSKDGFRSPECAPRHESVRIATSEREVPTIPDKGSRAIFEGSQMMIVMTTTVARVEPRVNSRSVGPNATVYAGSWVRVGLTSTNNKEGLTMHLIAFDGDDEPLGWVFRLESNSELLRPSSLGYPRAIASKKLVVRDGRDDRTKKVGQVVIGQHVRVMERSEIADSSSGKLNGTVKALIASDSNVTEVLGWVFVTNRELGFTTLTPVPTLKLTFDLNHYTVTYMRKAFEEMNAARHAASCELPKQPAGRRPAARSEASKPSRHRNISEPATLALMFNCFNAAFEVTSWSGENHGVPFEKLPGELSFDLISTKSKKRLGRVGLAKDIGMSFLERVLFPDEWLFASEHGLQHDGWQGSGSLGMELIWGRHVLHMTVSPWLSYGCSVGARFLMRKLQAPGGLCATVQRILNDDRVVARIDGFSIRDGVKGETILDLQPSMIVRTSAPSYPRDTKLLLLHEGNLVDAKVLHWLGSDDHRECSRHLVMVKQPEQPTGVQVWYDLNQLNHLQVDASNELDAAGFEAVRVSYCAHLIKAEDKVEDAITGNWLLIKDQLIFMAAMEVPNGCNPPQFMTVSDVPQLVKLMVEESQQRHKGTHLAQPVLCRAGPGTGKTWMLKQSVFLLATELREARAGSGIRLIPIIVFVQRIVSMLRELGADPTALLTDTGGMMRWYVRNAFADHPDQCQLLLHAYEMRALIILVDGVDEAAGLREFVEAFVHYELVPSGNRLAVTSRPEGIDIDEYSKRFVVMNLLQLSEQQQRNVIHMQLKGNAFFEHLVNIAECRKDLDVRYCLAFRTEAVRTEIEAMSFESVQARKDEPMGGNIVESKNDVDSGCHEKSQTTMITGILFVRRWYFQNEADESWSKPGHPNPPIRSELLQQMNDAMTTPTAGYASVLSRLDKDVNELPSPCTRAQLDGCIERLEENQPGGIFNPQLREAISQLGLQRKLPFPGEQRESSGMQRVPSIGLWQQVIRVTDSLFAATERHMDAINYLVGAVAATLGLAQLALQVDGTGRPLPGTAPNLPSVTFRDPVSLWLNSTYAVATAPDEMPADIWGAKFMMECETAEQYLNLCKQLALGLEGTIDGAKATLMMTDLKNTFALGSQHPTHLRYMQSHMLLTHEEESVAILVQIEHTHLLNRYEEMNYVQHHRFFLHRVLDISETEFDIRFEKLLVFIVEAIGVPVLLSLLLLTYSSATNTDRIDLNELPVDRLQLYKFGITSALRRRALISFSKPVRAGSSTSTQGATTTTGTGASTVVAGASCAGGSTSAAGAAGAKEEGNTGRQVGMANTRRRKEKRKGALVQSHSAVGGPSLVSGQADTTTRDRAKNQSHQEPVLDLNPILRGKKVRIISGEKDVAEGYALIMRILSRSGQTGFDMRTATTSVVPKSHTLHAPVAALVEHVLAPIPYNEQQLLELLRQMLRGVAVSNQENGRREFTSKNVACALGGNPDELVSHRDSNLLTAARLLGVL